MRLADADRLAAEPGREAADGVFCSISAPDSAVHAESPLPMTLVTSFDQRSPHRLGVTMALSAVPTSRHTSSTRP